LAKLVVLPRRDLRVFGQMLENGDRTYTRAEIRTLDKAIAKIDAALGGWGEQFVALAAELRRRRMDAAQADAEHQKALLDDLVVEENRRTQALNDAPDADAAVSVVWEDAEFDLVKAKWGSVDAFLGNRDARRLVMAIDDALAAAETVGLTP
jgi:multidrug resistance efflux pump